MSFIPEEELSSKSSMNLAPMIDFLFLMLVFFASLAVSRVTTIDTDIDLVELKNESRASLNQNSQDLYIIHINIDSQNQYKWVTDIRDYVISNAYEIKQELTKQFERGILPQDKSKTHVLLKIDKNAQWEPILKAIVAIREAGFEARPVYEPEESQDSPYSFNH